MTILTIPQPAQLTQHEARELCKKIVAHAETLRENMATLRDGKGWVALGYESWSACLEAEFGYTPQHANYLLRMANVKADVGRISSISLNDHQAHELEKVPEDRREEVLTRATKEADGKPLTAKAIKEAADDVLDAPFDLDYSESPNDNEAVDFLQALRARKEEAEMEAEAVEPAEPHFLVIEAQEFVAAYPETRAKFCEIINDIADFSRANRPTKTADTLDEAVRAVQAVKGKKK